MNLDLRCALFALATIALLVSPGQAHSDRGRSSHGGGDRCSPDWEVVDDFQLQEGEPARAFAFAGTRREGIFVGGFARASDTGSFEPHWIVRRSLDGGRTWHIDELFQAVPGQTSVPNDLAVARNGDVFAVGSVQDDTNRTVWLVRRRDARTGIWSTVDVFSTDRESANAVVVETDDAGNTYVGGAAWDGSGAPGGPPARFDCILRRSGDGGETWITVDEFYAGPGRCATDLLARGNGRLFMSSGPELQPGDGNTWIVERSADGGESFSTIDEFQKVDGQTSNAFGMARRGNELLVAGAGRDETGTAHWMVRSGRVTSARGPEWQVFDDFQLVDGETAAAFGALFGRRSRALWVTGIAGDGSSFHWIVRRSRGPGRSWTVDLDYQLVPGQSAFGQGLGMDWRGGLYAFGDAEDGVARHWIVQKRRCERSAR